MLFIKIRFHQKITNLTKMNKKKNCPRGFGIKGDVEERSNKENSICSGGVFEQLVPCGEKTPRLSLGNQSKNI